MKHPSSAHAYEEDTCAVLAGDSTILGSVALGEAADARVGLGVRVPSIVSSSISNIATPLGTKYVRTYDAEELVQLAIHPQFGQPSRVAPAGRAPCAQWKKKELGNKG